MIYGLSIHRKAAHLHEDASAIEAGKGEQGRRETSLDYMQSVGPADGMSAYMTVEASLIMPMVLCVLVICIYVAFLLYDCCVLYQEAYLVCLRESYRKDADGPSVNTGKMEEEADEILGNRIFAVSSISASASSKGLWSVYDGTAVVAPAVFGSYGLMPKGIWNISFSAQSRKNDPAWTIRSWRRKSYVIKEGLSSLIDAVTEQSSEQTTAIVTTQ